jgi:hypothetical protein
MLTLHIILSSLACPALPQFSTLYHKRQDCYRNVTEYKTCALIFSAKLSRNISLSLKN